MAQWKETLEPYIKVQEKIKTAATNPTAGGNLIIGCTIISDAGPSTPTLITSQKEFLSTYASQEISDEYMKVIDSLYGDGNDTVASTMWLNAYRLAGSASLLVTRAFKGQNIYFAKPLVRGDKNDYIVKDGQLLKKVQSFKIVVDTVAEGSNDGWSIALGEIGVVGNRANDSGAQYDFYVKDLGELVSFVNDTPKFFSPAYKFYSDEKGTVECEASKAKSVIFQEVYVGNDVLDLTEKRCTSGYCYLIVCEPDWTIENADQKLIDLSGISTFDEVSFYATNAYNSSTDLKIRIRRFNHDAVITKELNAKDANANGSSPYIVLENVLKTYEANAASNNGKLNETITDRDFYELAILDPSVSGSVEYYNIGRVTGRGDMTVSDLNGLLNMIQVNLPDNMLDLGLDYYGYTPTAKKNGWVEQVSGQDASAVTNYTKVSNLPETATPGTWARVGYVPAEQYKYDGTKWAKVTNESTAKYEFASLTNLSKAVKSPASGDIAIINGKAAPGTYYKYQQVEKNGTEEIVLNLSIDSEKYEILKVSDSDLQKGLDEIENNEVYQVEGLTDLGNTNPAFQNYLANICVNSNYFGALSTINSTNYLAIANSAARISKDSSKLYFSSPWDVDTGTAGIKFYCSPSVLYWETVCRNKTLSREFMSTFGQRAVAQVQDPVVEFNKRQRQLLLSKKINTIMWDTQISAYVYNDCYVKQSEDNVMNEDGNVRLGIRISKSIPRLLRQFHGRHINDPLYSDMNNVLDYWFKSTILPLGPYTIDDYRITIKEVNDDNDRRANRCRVLVEVRFNRSLKYIEVFNNYLDLGLDFSGTI